MAKAYENNPDLNAARAGLRATDEGVPIARAGLMPKLSAGATLNAQNMSGNISPLQRANEETAQVELTVTQPIFDGFQTLNNVRAAEFERVCQPRAVARHPDQHSPGGRTGLCRRRARQGDREHPPAEPRLPARTAEGIERAAAGGRGHADGRRAIAGTAVGRASASAERDRAGEVQRGRLCADRRRAARRRADAVRPGASPPGIARQRRFPSDGPRTPASSRRSTMSTPPATR